MLLARQQRQQVMLQDMLLQLAHQHCELGLRPLHQQGSSWGQLVQVALLLTLPWVSCGWRSLQPHRRS
jgi:hypothetical protein